MSRQPESRIVKSCLSWLRDQGGWWVKIHGGPFQAAGIPDIIGCCKGQFYGIEVKTPSAYSSKDHGCSPLQKLTLSQLVNNGAHATVIESIDRLKEWWICQQK